MTRKTVDIDLNEVTGLNSLNESAADLRTSLDHLVENPGTFTQYIRDTRAKQTAEFKNSGKGR